LADRTNGRAFNTKLCLSSVTHALWLNGMSCRKTVWTSKCSVARRLYQGEPLQSSQSLTRKRTGDERRYKL